MCYRKNSMIDKRLNNTNFPENGIGFTDIVKFYVYILGFVDSFRAGSGWKWFYSVTGGYRSICEISASGWFPYKEKCYDARGTRT